MTYNALAPVRRRSFLAIDLIATCKDRGWAYISGARKNRNFFPHGRDRDKR